jgi:peptidoglycan/xylan/chitin deacetylase (PgdA/CDA1 family)
MTRFKWFDQKLFNFFVKTNGVFSKPLYGGMGHIFMLHRVLPEQLRKQYTFNRSLAITPEHLENIILYLKSENYCFVSLDEIHTMLLKGKSLKQKFICLTLDDGYRDNMEFGFPVFKKHNVPFTIYVTNSFPNATAHLWWYWLEEKVNNSTSFSFNGNLYACYTDLEKQNTYNTLREKVKNMSYDQRKIIVADFFNLSTDEVKSQVQKIALSWEELKQISTEPLVTIGAHTVNHLSLANLTYEETTTEVIESKRELEQILKRDIDHFAYPYGGLEDAKDREWKIAEHAKFKTAVMNHPGNLFKNNNSLMMHLPRYPLGEKTTFELLNYHLNGITHYRTQKNL